MKIGIIKERKTPVDHRVPLTPAHCEQLLRKYPELEIVVEPSNVRAFTGEEYQAAGIQISNDLSSCDVLMGVKEVPKEELIPNKTYFFFSHTIKKQPYNKELLQTVLQKKIRLVDYECLRDENEQRVVAFGRWAGIVGAYNGIKTFGEKHEIFQLKAANKCKDMEEMWGEFSKVKLPPIKILLTGGGRVTKGAQEVLDDMKIKNVVYDEYMNKEYEKPIYIQLDSDAYNQRKDGSDFDFQHFYKNAGMYESTFGQYLSKTDLLIAGAYWDPNAPALFTKEDAKSENFNIDVVADITCDIEGSIASTIRSTTIADPVYDYNRATSKEEKAYSNMSNITVMAVDNLPCELPRDASKSFGDQLIENVFPSLLKSFNEPIIAKASITNNGTLTSYYTYLSDYIL